jgi:hypothetical protein
MKQKQRSLASAPAAAPKPVTLAELTALCQQWFDVVVTLPNPVTGQPGPSVSLRVRRLSPEEDVRIQLILTEALPEFKPKLGPDGKPVVGKAEVEMQSITSPEYLERSSRQQRLGRALVVYLACEQFHTDPHGATLRDQSAEAIAAWVQTQAHESVLDEIYRVAASQPVTAAQAEVFTRAIASRRS